MKFNLIKLIRNWLIHFALIMLMLNASIVVSVYKFNENSTEAWDRFVRHNISIDTLLLLVFLLLVEINYKLFFRRVSLRFFIVFSVVMSLAEIITVLFILHHNEWQKYIPDIIAPVLISAGYNLLYALARDYFYQKQYKKELQMQQSESELNALKAQLNPHFLFNSLNYLYGTALKEQAKETAIGIDQLSDLMRYTVAGMEKNFVPLAEEVSFIQNYLALQQARLPVKDSIKLNVHFNVPDTTAQIAPLLLLPFIENAFKYGISIDHPCFINIALDIINGQLTLSVNNSIVKNRAEVSGNNTGIKNTIKRLDLLYADKYKIACNNTENDYHVQLQIDLNSSHL